MTRHSRKRLLFWLKTLFRTTVVVLVTWGIWRTVDNARDQFAERNIDLGQLDLGWFVAAGVFYLLGIFPSCLFWHKTLYALGQAPAFVDTLRAFYIGHLGKYVPGKALVVVIRTSLIRSGRVNAAVAATSVFIETLTMMAVGAVVAALILGFVLRDQPALLALALALACGAGLPTLPPVFRRLVHLAPVHRVNPHLYQALQGLDFPLIRFGWLTVAVGWVLLGFSLWATIQAIPHHGLGPLPYELPLLTACVALAMVAGFLSLLPGGMGVREWIVMTLLSPSLGPVVAVLSAVALRLVWLGSELIVAAILYLAVRPAAESEPPDPPFAS